MLMDVNKHINIDKRGKFSYFYIPCFELKYFISFTSKLDNNSLFTVIPLISPFGKDGDPHLILSKQILMTSYSSPVLIDEFLNNQLDKAILDFDLDLNNKFFYIILKFKKIEIFI